MSYIHIHRCLFLFSILMLSLNIDFSFADSPAYSCFVLSNSSEANGYKVTGAERINVAAGSKNSSIRQGWILPEPSFRIMDKNNENGVEIITKLREKKFDMHAYRTNDNTVKHKQQSEGFFAGYVTASKPIGKKGVSVAGCSNATVNHGKVHYNQQVRTDKGAYMLSRPCCVLTVIET